MNNSKEHYRLLLIRAEQQRKALAKTEREIDSYLASMTEFVNEAHHERRHSASPEELRHARAVLSRGRTS